MASRMARIVTMRERRHRILYDTVAMSPTPEENGFPGRRVHLFAFHQTFGSTNIGRPHLTNVQTANHFPEDVTFTVKRICAKVWIPGSYDHVWGTLYPMIESEVFFTLAVGADFRLHTNLFFERQPEEQNRVLNLGLLLRKDAQILPRQNYSIQIDTTPRVRDLINNAPEVFFRVFLDGIEHRDVQ